MDEYDGLTPKQIRDIEDAEREEYAVSRIVFGRDWSEEIPAASKRQRIELYREMNSFAWPTEVI